MDRRTLLKGLIGVGAGLILPPTLEGNVEAVRRYWALDKTMVPGSWLTIPQPGRLLLRGWGEIWGVDVVWPDGGHECHVVRAPDAGSTRIRLSRSDWLAGATIRDYETGTLLMGYGQFYKLPDAILHPGGRQPTKPPALIERAYS